MLKLVCSIIILINVEYVFSANLQPHEVLPAIQTNIKLIDQVEKTLQRTYGDARNTVWYKKPESILSILDGKTGLMALDKSLKTFNGSLAKKENLPSSIAVLFSSNLNFVNDPSLQLFFQGLTLGDPAGTPVSNDLINGISKNGDNIHKAISNLDRERLYSLNFATSVEASCDATATPNRVLSFAGLFSDIANYVQNVQTTLASYLQQLSQLVKTLNGSSNNQLQKQINQLIAKILSNGNEIKSQIAYFKSESTPNMYGFLSGNRIFTLNELSDSILDEFSKEAENIQEVITLILKQYN